MNEYMNDSERKPDGCIASIIVKRKKNVTLELHRVQCMIRI